MTSNEIIEAYDQNPNLTLKELSRMSGRTVQSLKRLLLQSPADEGFLAAYISEGLGEK